MHELALACGYTVAFVAIVGFAAVLFIVLIEDRIDQWPD